MTHEEAIEQLDALTNGDPEAAHHRADEILMSYLASQGHVDVAEAFERAQDRVGFWYA